MISRAKAAWVVAGLGVASVIAAAIPSQAQQITVSALTDYTVVSDSVTYQGFDETFSVDCPAGLHVIGGGASSATVGGSPTTTFALQNSAPTATGTGWDARWRNFGGSQGPQVVLTVTAICANTD